MVSWPVLAVLALLSWLGTIVYRRIWARAKGPGLTAKGYGVLLPFFITACSIAVDTSSDMIWAGIAISVMTAIYWFDDIDNLNVKLRFSLQFGAGALMAWLVLRHGTGALPLPVPVACAIAGAANVGLTNMVNFYDGADLNIALFLILVAAVMLGVHAANPDMVPAALAILAFTLPFARVNRTPDSIYFGDGGSFAVASLVTLFTVAGARDGDGRAALTALPLMLPAMDVACVFGIRIRRREDLLSRNYHHLYQQLQRRYRGFWYLLPQPAFTVALLAAAFGLMAVNLSPLVSVVVASLVLTPLLYFASRAVFLKGPEV